MKKMISTQGLTFGEFCDENMTRAIKERISPRLEHMFSQLYGEEVHTNASLSFDVINREVRSIVLSYTIDNATRERLSHFRFVCDWFFCLDYFTIDYERPCVYFEASDMYDKGCLIEAIGMLSVCLTSVACAVDEKKLDEGEIYTPSGDTIIQVPNVPKYRIKEGTRWMVPSALQHCPHLRFLDIPSSVMNHEELLDSAPKVKYKKWKTLYDGTDPYDDDDDDNEEYTLDEHYVAYSKDGKKLLFARYEFHEVRYEVPDGVEEIADGAFCCCSTYVELSIPRSVRIIGGTLFGNSGHIEIRDT